ncbi:MAG: AAA family ATPase [Fusobacterium periodonticum]|nr:AAA family ATPase [Fusobacterium periodonticum]
MENKKVKGLLLTWNKKNLDWSSKYKEFCDATREGTPCYIFWNSTVTNNLSIGDEVFLQKTGDNPNGIIAHGYIIKKIDKQEYSPEIFESEEIPKNKRYYYNPFDETKKMPENQCVIGIKLDKCLDYDRGELIPVETLKRLNDKDKEDQMWSPQASGIEIKETILPELKEMWSKLINGEENSETPNGGDEKENMKKEFDKNVIFYGPPGTGKTYTTAKRAVEICKNESEEDLIDYSEIMKKYNELKENNRIEFITFHQSYGYEEFIEGIKPVVSNEDYESEDESENKQELKTNIKIENDIKYDVVDGIFKEFCDNARKAIIETHDNDDVSPEAIVWKVTVRNNVIKDCFENSRVRIDWNFDDAGAVGFVEEVKKGDIIITTDGSRTRINGIAVVTDDKGYTLDKEKRDTTTRNVKWLAKNIDENIKNINKEKMLHRRTVARVPNMKVEDIIKLAKEKEPEELSKIVIKENKEPYVFIIDEINRGNISKIFGELITLIETTKRAGKEECISTKLPYSKEEFTVPDNVYIIGTMNTADRSIALMDTALRRRFKFEEMLPNYDLLKDVFVEDEGVKVNIGAMLKVINERIEYIYDREHTIGHAVFLELKENNNIDKLENIFKKSVIPLLQEYFYEDYEKIRLILGDNAKDEDEQFIFAESIKPKDVFEGDIGDIDIPDKKYIIKHENFRNIMAYKNISKKLSDE